MSKKSKKKYSFPILKRKEIISCMKELGIRSISEIDLKSPHEEQVKIIYAEILEKLMGISVLTTSVPYAKLSFFSHPSLHESSIIAIRLFRELIKFMQKVGVRNFSISDLISPESSRTIRNLSAIINFARWREQKYQIYLMQKSKFDELNKSLKSITSENKKLANEFVNLTEKKETEKPQVEALNKDLKELYKTMDSADSQLSNKQEIAKKIKKEYYNLKMGDQEKKAILQTNAERIQNLEKQIVKSPERIKKELKMLSNKIQKDKIEITTKTQKLNHMMNKINQLKLSNGSINKRIHEMKDINHLKNEKFKLLQQELQNGQNVKIGKEKELKSITKQHKLINANLNKKKSEYSQLREEHSGKKHEINKKMEQISHLKKEHSQKRIAKQTHISNLDKKYEEKKESIDNLLKENKNSINQINSKYKQLLDSVNAYHYNMRTAMDTW